MHIAVDEPFALGADALRRARGLRHKVAIGLSALVLLSGALAIGVILTGYKGGESAAGMSMPVAIALYAAGSVTFAWGAAHGTKHSYTWWLAVTLIIGGVLAIGIFAVAAFGGGAGGGDGSSSGPADPSKQPSGHLPLAASIVDRSYAESVLGVPVEGPFQIAGKGTKSAVVWYGPSGQGGDASAKPLLSARVRHAAHRGRVTPSVRRARRSSGIDLVAAVGWSKHWQVALNLRMPQAPPDVDQLLLKRVVEGLTALESTD